MPIHGAAEYLGSISISQLLAGAATLFVVVSLKAWAGGRRTTWERDWAGKMILIAAPPSSTILALIDHLLHLPSPPQILFLPPVPRLSEELVTLLHTIRLGTTNPLAQLHAEPLPHTPTAVREFAQKWAAAPTGMAGEGGRRIDAIVLGSGWEVPPKDYSPPSILDDLDVSKAAASKGRTWTTHQFQFHFLTSFLPQLLRQPAERNIRIVALVPPTWSAALPSLMGKKPTNSAVQNSGRRAIQTLLLMRHFQLILDTLASAAVMKAKPVPNPNEDKPARKRDESVKSNVMAVPVIMGWARSEVLRGFFKADRLLLNWIAWILLYPLMLIVTPSPSRVIHSILFALQAPVRYHELSTDPASSSADTGSSESTDPRRSGVRGGDVIRDCAVADMPGILSDPDLCRATYDSLEKEVEKGVKEEAEQARKAAAAEKTKASKST